MLTALVVAVVMGTIAVLLTFVGSDDLGRATAERACGEKYLEAHEVQQGVAIPRDFVPVAALRCVFSYDSTEDGRVRYVRVEQRADGDLSALAVALKEKNLYSTKQACTLIGRRAVVITLVNAAGLHVTPTAPTYGCGDALPSVLMAVAQLSWSEVSRTPLEKYDVMFTAGARCGPAVLKPVVATATAHAPTGPPVFPRGPEMKVCHYALVPGGGDLRDSHPDDYTLTGGRPLESLRAAISAAAPVTGPCNRPQPNTVLIYPSDANPDQAVTVEIGGCFRMLDSAGNLWQLNAAAIATFIVTRPFTTL
jgi:hypothetical protein